MAYEAVSGWKKYVDELAQLKVAEFARDYLAFLSSCKTERETIAWAAKMFKDSGLGEDELVLRPFREKALFVARRGKAPLVSGINLIAAHADSPRLDFKQHPLTEQAGIAQARTHYYGGIRKYQWLARPLALHGIIALENGEKVRVRLGEDPQDPVFCVADLLPHLAKKQEGQTLNEAFEAEKLNIVLGQKPLLPAKDNEEAAKEPAKEQLLAMLYARYGIGEEDLITAELEAVPAGPARFVGFDQSLLGGYGQDDRICVFCAVMALLSVMPQKPERAAAIILWDKEEIGSDGATGAASQFLRYCCEDLAQNWDGAKMSEMFLNTRALSADVTAALDPDYQDAHEKQNAARIGYGPCFAKFTGSRGKYGASEADAEYFASVRAQLNAAGIPWQAAELGKVDLGGGGTVALFLAALGMNVIDLGPALLSMHSPFELASVVDLYATKEAYRVFLAN